MKFNKVLLITSFIFLSTNHCFADVSIPYGEGAGKVDYSNANKYKNYNEQEESLPTGPSSFRIINDNTWIADTVGGKLMQYDKNGKLISEFSVLPTGIKPYENDEEGLPLPNIIIDDIAPVLGQYGDVEGWWILDSNKNMLVKFSKDGKPLAQLRDPYYGQLFRIEVGLNGNLFVADNVNNKIYIYDKNGDFLSEQNWEGSGMAVTGKDSNLYRLIYFNEEKKYILVTTDVKGKVIKSKVLDVEMDEPELWWVDEAKEEAVITYTTASESDNDLDKEELDDSKIAELTGSENDFEIIRVGFDGKVKASGKLHAPSLMNRFIEHSNYEDVYIGKCNYFEAPKGNFEIIPYKMP